MMDTVDLSAGVYADREEMHGATGEELQIQNSVRNNGGSIKGFRNADDDGDDQKAKAVVGKVSGRSEESPRNENPFHGNSDSATTASFSDHDAPTSRASAAVTQTAAAPESATREKQNGSRSQPSGVKDVQQTLAQEQGHAPGPKEKWERHSPQQQQQQSMEHALPLPPSPPPARVFESEETARADRASRHSIIIENGDCVQNPPTPPLQDFIILRREKSLKGERVSPSATQFLYDPETEKKLRSYGTQIHGNSAGVQACLQAPGMHGTQSRVDLDGWGGHHSQQHHNLGGLHQRNAAATAADAVTWAMTRDRERISLNARARARAARGMPCSSGYDDGKAMRMTGSTRREMQQMALLEQLRNEMSTLRVEVQQALPQCSRTGRQGQAGQAGDVSAGDEGEKLEPTHSSCHQTLPPGTSCNTLGQRPGQGVGSIIGTLGPLGMDISASILATQAVFRQQLEMLKMNSRAKVRGAGAHSAEAATTAPLQQE
ncbi:unnamed protein product [Chrysoparadoxa australica]